MSIKKRIRVAIASDQAIFLRGLASLVLAREEMLLVGQAYDREEALECCILTEPDVLLLDLKIAPEDGKELLADIRKRWNQVKVIFFYSVYNEAQWLEGLDDDQTYHFLKDISEEEFAAAIKGIVYGAQVQANEAASDLGKHAARSRPSSPAHKTHSKEQGFVPESPHDARDRELRMAGQIQADILPESPPKISGWDISGRLISARETSGDFYDFIPFDQQRWGFVVADVTDKGIGAALFMALSSSLLRTYTVRYPTLPALAFDAVNERILTDTRGSMFVSAIYGILEVGTGRFRFVNAGHPPGLLFSMQKGKPQDYLRTTGMALGMIERAHWQQRIVKFSPGDVLLLYTDGISEAQNRAGEFFGEQNLIEVLRACNGKSAYEIQEAVLAELSQFTGQIGLQDDVALVVIMRK
jgi:DNA-binding NarL/FixJ family response regulator